MKTLTHAHALTDDGQRTVTINEKGIKLLNNPHVCKVNIIEFQKLVFTYNQTLVELSFLR